MQKDVTISQSLTFHWIRSVNSILVPRVDSYTCDE